MTGPIRSGLGPDVSLLLWCLFCFFTFIVSHVIVLGTPHPNTPFLSGQLGEEYHSQKYPVLSRQPQLQQHTGDNEGAQHASTAFQWQQQAQQAMLLQGAHAGHGVYPLKSEAAASGSASSSCPPRGLWAMSAELFHVPAAVAGCAACASDQPLVQQAAGPSANCDAAGHLPLHTRAQPISTAELASTGAGPATVLQAAPAVAAAAPAVHDGAASAGAQHGHAAGAAGTGAPGAPAQDTLSTNTLQDQPQADPSTALMKFLQEYSLSHPVSAEGSYTATTAGSPAPQQPAELSGLSAGQLFEAMYSLTARLEGWPAQALSRLSAGQLFEAMYSLTARLEGWPAQALAAGWSPPTAAPADATCELQGNFWHTPQPAAAVAEHSAAQQDTAAFVQPAPHVAAGALDIPPGALVTPQLMVQAYKRSGPLNTAACVLAALAVALLVRGAWSYCCATAARLLKKRSPLSGLPLSIQQDPKAVEAFLALRRLGAQQRAWWRLVGVAGVAVCRAVGERSAAEGVASKAEGGARFARQLLRQQKQRLLREQDAALADRDTQLREDFAVQLAGVESAHAEVVSGLQQEIAQHQKKQEEQSELLVTMSEERALLKSQQRQNSETSAVQQATINGLQAQVQEAKLDAARVQQEYNTYKQQTARGQGWREALQVKLDEAGQRETTLSSKCEGLQQQLVQAQRSISQLQADVRRKDDALAARDTSNKELTAQQQQLLQDKQEQQQLLDQQCSRAKELQVQLDGERNQHAQTRIRLQHEVVQRQTAEESLRHERNQRHAMGEKADGLQLQLTTKTQDLSQLTAEHATATQTLQQLREGFAELSLLHQAAQGVLTSNKAEISSLQEKLVQRDRQLAAQDLQLQEAQEQGQLLQQHVSDLQQQLDEQLAVAGTQEENIEQLIEECTQERAKLAESRQELHAAVTQCHQARERCEALEEQVEQQQRDADLLEQQLEAQQEQLKLLSADLERRKANLQQAQEDLGRAMEQYEDEDRKNRELGAENGKLQGRVLNLTEHKRQLEEEVDEVTAEFERVGDEHTSLQATFTALQEKMQGIVDQQDTLLQQITANSTAVQQKLAITEAEVVALTRERDDLKKELYFAEMARDQTKAAKALAAEDAIKARQALTEEKLRKTVARTTSMPSGRGAVAASAAGGELSSSRPWLRSNSGQPAKKWGVVEPAYLHQHFKDKEGNIRRCGSPTRSNSNSESVPDTPRSTATSFAGDSGSVHGGRHLLRSAASNASAAASAAAAASQEDDQDLEGAEAAAAAGGSPRLRPHSRDGSQHNLAAAVAAAAGVRLRRLSPLSPGGSSSRLQERFAQQQEQDEQQLQQQEQVEQGQERSAGQLQRSSSGGSLAGSSCGSGASPSPGRTVAVAQAGLRRNFSSGDISAAAGEAAAAAAGDDTPGAADVQPPTADAHAPISTSLQQLSVDPEVSQPHQLDTADDESSSPVPPGPSPASTAATGATPPLEQGGKSPSSCSNGTKSRISAADLRDMRPLALSPVQQSSDLVLTGADSPSSVSFSSRMAAAEAAGSSILDAVSPAAAAAGAAAVAEAAAAGANSAAGADGQDTDTNTAAADAGVMAGVEGAAAALGCITGLVTAASAVTAPGTPAATSVAVASAAAGDAAAGSSEGQAEDAVQFFTPLHAAPSSSCSSSYAAEYGAAAAAAAVEEEQEEGSIRASNEVPTPFFTPLRGGSAAAAAEGAAAEAASDPFTGAAAAEVAAGQAAREAGSMDAATPRLFANNTVAEPQGAAGGAAGADAGGSGGCGSSPWLSRLSGHAPSHCSSFSHAMDDGDVVLIGSLSEADFAVMGMGCHNAAADSPVQQQQQQQEENCHEDEQHEEGPAAAGFELEQQLCEAAAQLQEEEEDADGSSMCSSTAGSPVCSPAKEGLSRGGARGVAVPRLPLFQLHAAAGAAGSLPAAAPAAQLAAAGAGSDWDLGDEDLSNAASSCRSSISSEHAALSGEDAEDADVADGCASGDNSSQEDTAVPSDVDATPPRMFIHNVPAAATGAAAVAAAAVASGGLSPRAVQHSPRYQDQRAMHSPRYLNQQQHLQQQALAEGQQQSHAAAGGADGDCSETSSDDLAGGAAEPDVTRRSVSSLSAAAGAGVGLLGSSKDPKSSKGTPPGASPPRAAAAAGGGSPPAATAAMGAGFRQQRRSSRLSDPNSSSCSSIKSLVAHSRQQQQQAQALRRTGSNSSLGSAGSGAFASVLGAGRSPARRSGSLDQHGLTKALGDKQHQRQGRHVRAASVGDSPSRNMASAAAAAVASIGAAAVPGVDCERDAVKVLLSSAGSDSTAAAAGVSGSASGHSLRGRSSQHGSLSLRRSRSGGHSNSSSQEQQQNRHQTVPSPVAASSPPPSAAGVSLAAGSAGFNTPPGPYGRAGRFSSSQIQQQQGHGASRSPGVMWKSLDDFVRASRGSGSTHSSPGVRWAGGVGSSVAGPLPLFMSPPAAVLPNPWGTPPPAAAGPGSGLGSLPGAVRGSTSSPAVGVGPSSPYAVTPAAATATVEGLADGCLAGVPVLPIAEGVCEGASDADSPNSTISGTESECGPGTGEGHAGQWVAHENPVYFELH